MKKIMIFLLISSLLLAKDINVGDLVKVKITGIEKEKIVEGFKKSNLELENIEKSEKRVASINNETWDFDLSMAIREYIDSRYQTHFINGNYEVVGMIDSEDIKFINNLDRYKFSKDSRDLKEETLKRVREIFEKVRGDKNV